MHCRALSVILCLCMTGFVVALTARANADGQFLPTGQWLSPTAAPGAAFARLTTGLRADGNADANGAVSAALSPDGTALLVLTSGYNTGFFYPNGKPIVHTVPDPLTGQPSSTTTANAQWIFLYDVSGAVPLIRQRINVPNTFCGLRWMSGGRFVVSGGADDRVYIFKATDSPAVAAAAQRYALEAPEVLLRHNSAATAPIPTYDGGLLKGTIAGGPAGVKQYLTYGFGAIAAGVDASRDGKTLYVANLQNDSLSIVDSATRRVRHEIHFFSPGGTTATGEYPFAVSVLSGPDGSARKIYVSSLRDGQVLVVDPSSGAFVPIAVGGEPNTMLLSADGSTLYVANGDDDSVDVIDTRLDRLARVISVLRAGYPYKGANPNGLALSADGKTLYVTLGGENALAVIDLAGGRVRGRIPTGWEPSSVAVSSDGRRLYVVNTRSEAGPSGYAIDQHDNPLPLPNGLEAYVYALEKAALLSLPVPGTNTLAALSRVVDRNNGFPLQPSTSPLMSYLSTKIHHVIYIMRENRTYDQILGDLGEGNGAPQLTEFPWPVTPNAHSLATQFVDLDNFYDSGDVSGDGWNWTLQGHANDYTDKSVPVNYGSGGFTFDWNGSPRNLNVSVPEFGVRTLAGERTTTLLDPSGQSNIEPGPKDITATEGDSDERPQALGGYIWDTILRAGKTHRHYGAYADEIYYTIGAPFYLPIDRHAFRHEQVQAIPLRPSLHGRLDPYYRGWDLNVPDVYRFEEWKREFDGFVKNGQLPNLEVLALMMDHFGNFKSNVAGLSTANTQIADNDYALGRLVETVSHSRYWNDTAIFVIEDDAQDGPDHVDAHRSVALIISAYTKRRAIVSTPYTTVSMLRTIEDLLGARPLGFNDANAAPMDAVFGANPNMQPYTAVIPGNLCRPPVHPDLVPECGDPQALRTAAVVERHSPAWWAAQTAGFDFRGPDRVNARAFNQVLWRGQMGEGPPNGR